MKNPGKLDKSFPPIKPSREEEEPHMELWLLGLVFLLLLAVLAQWHGGLRHSAQPQDGLNDPIGRAEEAPPAPPEFGY